MHTTTSMLLTAALALLGLSSEPAPTPTSAAPTPDPEQEIRACQQRCNEQGLDETDTATCRLNCRQAVEGRDQTHVIRWKTDKPMGGTVPGQDAAPTVTTVTKITPAGTTTETTSTTPAVAPQPTLPPPVVETPRQRYYFGLVDCQDRCNDDRDDAARARCKLRCLRLQPGPPPPRTATPPSSSKAPAAPSR